VQDVYACFLTGTNKNVPKRTTFTGVTIRVGTFGPHNVGNTRTNTHKKALKKGTKKNGGEAFYDHGLFN